MSVKKKIMYVVIAVLVIFVIYWGKYFMDLKYYNEVMTNVVISPVDFSKLEDGIYQGTFDAKIISATVSVQINEGKMTHVDFIEHKFERGKPAEGILEDVLSAQSLEVDTITGATNSSKTILKAIENALKQPPITQ